MTLLTFTVYSCIVQKGWGAPVSGDFVTWQSEPNTRGTWSILSSCVTTLILCVYTAIHMNVPAAWETPSDRRKQLAGWVLLGLIAPEIVLWIAWCQWSAARAFTKEMATLRANLLSENDQPLEESESKPKDQALHDLLQSWTMQHSFFLLMGGYQMPLNSVAAELGKDVDMEKTRRQKCVLDVNVFRYLRDGGHSDTIPSLSAADLAERSRADRLAKMLSCIQGLWLVIQLIGRLSARLVITELEVNTFAHVMCTLLMYIFWMKKPLNPTQPVWLPGKGLSVNLYLWGGPAYVRQVYDVLIDLNKSDSARPTLPKSVLDTPVTHYHAEYPYRYDSECSQCLRNQAYFGNQNMIGLSVKYRGMFECNTQELVSSLNDSYKDIGFINAVSEEICDEYDPNFLLENCLFNGDSIDITGSDVISEFLRLRQLYDRDGFTTQKLCNLGTDRLRHSSKMGSFDYIGQWQTTAVIAISCLYGGLHALLWQQHFPTIAERWIWRISSLAVAGNGVLTLLPTAALIHGKDVNTLFSKSPKWLRYSLYCLYCIPYGILVCLVSLLEILYRYIDLTYPALRILGIIEFVVILCRFYLVIEAFISLRSQPASAYETPQWSQWLIHL